MFFGSTEIDSAQAKQARSLAANYQLDQLNFAKYFHMFIIQDNQLRLVGLRHRHTLFIQNDEIVQLEAKACGCK